MKRLLLAFVLAPLSFSACTATVGTTIVTTPYIPSVKVVNNTDSPVRVQVGFDHSPVVPSKAFALMKLRNGISPLYEAYVQYPVAAQICAATEIGPVYPVPRWALDRELLGDLALTEKNYGQYPSQTVLREAVKDVKRFLVEQDIAGNRVMQKELDQWLSNVLKRGFGSETKCVGGNFVRGGDLTVQNNSVLNGYYSGGGQQVNVIFVNGERGNYSITF